MNDSDYINISLRENEWRLFINCAREWVKHVDHLAKTEDREDDDFVFMVNDAMHLDTIQKFIAEKLPKR